MNCINCGVEVGREIVCPNCGYDNTAVHKAVRISNTYYNHGLDMAQIRDMSGAIDMLERSLKFNKRNIDARNLLGLVYFEIGEVVSALSEWVISKNIKSENNIASEYIEKLRANPRRLENIQQTIKRYNRALDSCRGGEEDAAVIMLKKVIDANPKLIKAYYLQALIFIKNEEYEKARKVLKRAIPIDRTNPTALRFLQEIDEKTGTVTDIDDIRKGIVGERRRGLLGFFKRRGSAPVARNLYTTINWDHEEHVIAEPVVQPIAFHQRHAFMGVLNLVVGMVMGAFIIGLIVVPAVERSIGREADEQVNQYAQTLVTQNAYISTLEAEIESINEEVSSQTSSIESASGSISAMEELLNAYGYYADDDYEEARELLLEIDSDSLSETALAIYDEILEDIEDSLFEQYYQEGYLAFQNGSFGTAIIAFTNALEYREDDFEAMAYLAHSHRLNGNADGAREAFNAIVEAFPNTTRAATAQRYITSLTTGDLSTSVGISSVNMEIASEAADETAEESDEEE